MPLLDDELIARVKDADESRRAGLVLALLQAEGHRVELRAGARRPIVVASEEGLLEMLASGNATVMMLVWPEWETRAEIIAPE